MKAEGKSLRFLCGINIFEVPFFQRPYVWEEDNWQELLDGLLEEEAHFLGSIIIKWEDDAKDGKKAIIIDGQQRITTISILIKAFYDCMEAEKNFIEEDVRNALFYKSDTFSSEYKISLQHSNFDSDAYQKVIGEVKKEDSSSSCITSPFKDKKIAIKNETNRIERCYSFFYEELQKIYNEDKNKVQDLWNSIFDDKQQMIVVIELDQNEEEQKIFDTINSAGLKLSFADIVKNAIYQKLMSFNADKEAVLKVYENTWKKIFEDDEDKRKYWASDKKRSSGYLRIQNIELFLLSYAVIKDIFSYKRRNTFSKLTNYYKIKLAEIKNEAECKAFINELIEYAKLYEKNFPIIKEDASFNFEDYKIRLLKILDSQNVTSYHPYILYLFEKYKDDERELEIALKEVERFVVKTTIIGDTKNSGVNCEDFVKSKDRSSIQRKCAEIKNSEIRTKMKTGIKNNDLSKMLLFCIELHRRCKSGKYDTSHLNYKYQLEHIMPIEWKEFWRKEKVPYVDENGDAIEDETDGVQKRDEMVTSLGNMTLLSKRLNKEIRNYAFRVKIEGDGKIKGIKDYSTLSITVDDIIKGVYEKNKEWNEKEINKRAELLAGEIIEIWG